MTLRERLIEITDHYCQATGMSKARISTIVFSGGRRIEKIEAGGDVLTGRYETAMQWFSDNWPESALWPADIPRPDRQELRMAAR